MDLVSRLAFEAACSFNRLYQGFPGRWRVASWLGSQRDVLTQLPARKRKIWRQTYLYIDPRDYYGGNKYLVWGLNTSEPIANILVQLVREGDCMLDIGANVGIYSALGSILVKKNGKIHAFEAFPDTFKKLRVLESSNKFNNIKAWNLAVSDKDGFVDIFPGPPEHTGITSMRNVDKDGQGATRVAASSIDSMADDIQKVRLIKLDVEGAEMLALKGMTSLIKRDNPYILAELSDGYLRELGSNKTEVVEYLESLGYEVYRVGKPIKKYIPRDELQCDILCVPAGVQPAKWRTDAKLPRS